MNFGVMVFDDNAWYCNSNIYLRNETSVPVFYRGNKTWVRVRVRMN